MVGMRQQSPFIGSVRNPLGFLGCTLRRSTRVPALVLGTNGNIRFSCNVSLGRMWRGVDVCYFLLRFKSACRARKLRDACVKILVRSFRRALRRRMKVPTLVFG